MNGARLSSQEMDAPSGDEKRRKTLLLFRTEHGIGEEKKMGRKWSLTSHDVANRLSGRFIAVLIITPFPIMFASHSLIESVGRAVQFVTSGGRVE